MSAVYNEAHAVTDYILINSNCISNISKAI